MRTLARPLLISLLLVCWGWGAPVQRTGRGIGKRLQVCCKTTLPAPPTLPVRTPRVPQGALFGRFCSQTGDEPGSEGLLREAAGDRQAALEICVIAKKK